MIKFRCISTNRIPITSTNKIPATKQDINDISIFTNVNVHIHIIFIDERSNHVPQKKRGKSTCLPVIRFPPPPPRSLFHPAPLPTLASSLRDTCMSRDSCVSGCSGAILRCMYVYISTAARLKIWVLGYIISIIFIYTHV